MQFRTKPLLGIVLLVMVLLSAACQREKTKVLLRYTPQVGSIYSFKFELNRPRAPMAMPSEMRVLSRDENGYRIQFSGILNELFSGSLTVTERHNSNHPGYISLNFPDDPVEPGVEWSGQVPWYHEDYYVLHPSELHLPASYKLLSIEQGKNGRYAIIEQRIQADVAVDGLVFYVGQVGVRWDREGRIAEVVQGYDGFGKLMVGDVVLGINGQGVQAAGGLNGLAETYIQHPKQDKTVTFTVLRNGSEIDIAVEKTVDELAVVKVYNKKDVVKTKYDVDRSILLSVEASSSYDVAYTSPTTKPFVTIDNYGGFHKFGFLSGRTSYREHIDSNGVAWTLSLVE